MGSRGPGAGARGGGGGEAAGSGVGRREGISGAEAALVLTTT